MENRTNNNTNFDFFESLVKATTLIHRPDSLEEHFIRAFKNARQMNYKYKTSFSEYLTIIARWKRPFEKAFQEEKIKSDTIIARVKNGTMKVQPIDRESIEKTRKSVIAHHETELETLNIHQFECPIPELLSIGIILSYKDIFMIEKALKLSYFHILGKKAIKQRRKEIAKGEDINEQKLTGFVTGLDSKQIKNIYARMNTVFFKTDKANFINLCTGKECYQIEWILKTDKDKPHKSMLAAFIEVILKSTKKTAKTHFGIEIKSLDRVSGDYEGKVKKFEGILQVALATVNP